MLLDTGSSTTGEHVLESSRFFLSLRLLTELFSIDASNILDTREDETDNAVADYVEAISMIAERIGRHTSQGARVRVDVVSDTPLPAINRFQSI